MTNNEEKVEEIKEELDPEEVADAEEAEEFTEE